MKTTGLWADINRLDRQRLLTYAIVYFPVGIGISMLGPLLPFLGEQVAVSLGQMGFAFTAQNLGYLIGSLGGGVLFDRLKSHHLIALSLALMVVSGTLIPLVSWFTGLLLVLFFFGLGVAVIDVGVNLNLVWIFKSRVGPYLNAIHFIFGVGAFFTPLIITTVLTWTGGNLTWAIWMLVLLFLPGFLGLLTISSPVNLADDQQTADEHPYNYGLILLMILLIFFAVGVQIGFGGWIFTYVSALGIADVTTASLITSVFWGSLTLGRLIGISVSKRVSPGSLLLFNFGCLVIVMGLILMWPLSPTMMWVGAAGLGLAISILFPTSLAFAKTKMHMTGKITGLFFMGSSLGMMLLPLLLGQVFDRFGGYAMMLVLFAAAVIGLALMVVIKTKRYPGESDRG